MKNFNNVFQCLLQDIGVSKDLNEHFRKHLTNSNEPLDIDFSIQVLSSGSWPFQQSLTFSLPTEVCVCVCGLIVRGSDHSPSRTFHVIQLVGHDKSVFVS